MYMRAIKGLLLRGEHFSANCILGVCTPASCQKGKEDMIKFHEYESLRELSITQRFAEEHKDAQRI